MTKELTKEQIENKKNNGWYKHSIDKECAFYQSNIYQWISYYGWKSLYKYEVNDIPFKTLAEAKEYAKSLRSA